ncbi:hypothetical protein L0P88_04845 [Muricauda sp. SCSIO 64092]|uniref:hypothetical protein n=1 Tax=Allomuricauda sp. SCSIO 64092 TaxID=2908842 RepID=UPI001FF4777D|nr:hypothetical protein [Muricauda sp. SCSIO 64092]UOY07878.1 hypothetical protein L0P88_04845 [Muricauda sp. SCSIO 64092]
MTESSSKSWLQRLKDESWEAELLVSAVAIYGIFQSFVLIDFLIDFLINKLNETQYVIGYFIAFMGILAFSILATMFIIHFILRSYWIGLVGLNSVFPDYSIKDSAYSEIYTKKMTDYLPKLSKSIDSIDELCSVIFSAAFTILGLYTYITVFSALYLFIFNKLKGIVPVKVLLIPIALIALLLVAQTILNIFANLKKLKPNARLQHLFFWVVKISSLILMGPLAKNFLQVSIIFGSNFKRKKSLVTLVLLFFIAGASLSVFQAQKTNLFHLVRHKAPKDSFKTYAYFYNTNNSESSFLLTPEIDSDVIEKRVMRLFIPIFDNELDHFEQACGIEKPKNSLKEDNAAMQGLWKDYLSCYQQNHFVAIDGRPVTVEFIKYDHPQTGQFGILGYIDLSDQARGQHQLKIVKNGANENSKEWTIPFYYHGNL